MTDDDSFSRRNVLENTAALGGLTLGSSGLAAAGGRSGRAGDSPVDDVTQLPQDQARRYLRAAHDPTQTKALRETLKGKGLRPTPNNPLAFDVATDHSEMAGRDPALVLLPFVERGNPKTATKAGFLTLLTVEADEGRVAASGFAFSAATRDAPGVSTASADAAGRWEMHGQQDGRSVQVASAPVSPSDGVSTQVNLGCTLCTVIVGGLCEAGVTSTSSSACVAICLPLAATLTGAAFCAAACAIIVDAIGAVGCAAGATAVCEYADAC